MAWINTKGEVVAFIAGFIILIGPVCIESVCPSDVINAAFQCLQTLTRLGQTQSMVAGADVEHVRAKCRDDSFQRAVDCVQNLMYSCRQSHEHYTLVSNLVNLDVMKRGFKQFCDNADYYEARSDCILSQHNYIDACIAQHTDDFQHNKLTVRNIDDKLQTVCGFFRGMAYCIDRPVRVYCDPKLADILVTFLGGFTPPICEQYAPPSALVTAGSASLLNCQLYRCYLFVIGAIMVVIFFTWNNLFYVSR